MHLSIKNKQQFACTLLATVLVFVQSGAFGQQVTKARPAPPGAWQQIGLTVVDFKTDRDVIVVAGADNFRKLKFHVFDAAVNMLNMHVIYENGEFDNIDLRFVIPAGGESRILDLNGGSRRIKKVEFWYRSQKPSFKGKAKVVLWGMK